MQAAFLHFNLLDTYGLYLTWKLEEDPSEGRSS